MKLPVYYNFAPACPAAFGLHLQAYTEVEGQEHSSRQWCQVTLQAFPSFVRRLGISWIMESRENDIILIGMMSSCALGSVRCSFAHKVVIHGAVDEWNFSSDLEVCNIHSFSW